MLAANENVVHLPESIVYSQLKAFLDKKNSINTRKAYEKDIKEFFQVIKNKDLEHLTEDDIQIKLKDIDNFQSYLLEKGDTGKTINRRITALHMFMKHIAKRADDYGLHVDITCFNNIDRMEEETEHHDAFEYDEYVQVADWVRDNLKDGKLKYSLIRYAVATGARIQECLNLKWDNFSIKKDHVVVKYKAKRNKKMAKELDFQFYNELLELKQDGEERVFPISTSTVQRMMDSIKKEFKIPKTRKIVFHSFRKTGGTFVYEMTGDINEARIFLGHENVNTTQIYLKKKEYGRIDAISVANSVDENFYKTLSHEELIEVIESMNKGQKLLLNVKAKELKKG